MGKKHTTKHARYTRVALALVMGGLVQVPAQAAHLVPLPEDLFENKENANPILDITNRAVSTLSSTSAVIPANLQVTSEDATISYLSGKHAFLYQANGKKNIRLRTDGGSDIHTPTIEAHLKTNEAALSGPLTIYQDEILVRAQEGGYYNWKDNRTAVSKVRLKAQGMIIRGSRIEYNTDSEGKEYITVYDAYVTTEDKKDPSVWVGAGTLTIYPGDYGKASRLSIATENADYTVPVLGWFTFSHSLNPHEGYIPGAGSRSHWGSYIENSYGILFGNRRVDGIMPTADYLATLHLDYRTRRGLAYGLDIEDIKMSDKYKDMTGLSTYLLFDEEPSITPTEEPREPIDSTRYRVALQALWDIKPGADPHAEWQLVTDINILSDRYLLRDFFPEISRTDDKPDNTVRLVRRTSTTQSMLYTRFAPNDYYMTNERIEASFYRVRSAIGNTGINYETNNSACIMRQYLPHETRLAYKFAIDNLRDNSIREYYSRLLNTESYFRVNTTHEFTSNLTAFKFLNITPKAGGAYTGYYDVGGIGSDNRLLGYIGCDLNMKFHRSYPGFKWKTYGLDGLNHLIQPYASYSQGHISSSNDLVPQVDVWSSTWGSTTVPMALDLAGFSAIDSWGNWNIWRIGLKNALTSKVEDQRIQVLSWDSFVDYNIDNPNTDCNFSNLYNIIRFSPSQRFNFYINTQTPTIDNGEGYSQYGTGVRIIPCAWLEASMGYNSIMDHPLLSDAEQFYIRSNIRVSEKTTLSIQWYYDIENGRMPIQQYSIFRHMGPWYVGATFYLRDNGGKRETGFGISFTLGETGSTMPISIL